jgi:hypothetical protein
MGSRKLKNAVESLVKENLSYQRECATLRRDDMHYLYTTRLGIRDMIELLCDSEDYDLPVKFLEAKYLHVQIEMLVEAAKSLGYTVFYDKYPVGPDGTRRPDYDRGEAILSIDPKFKQFKRVLRKRKTEKPTVYPVFKNLRAELNKLPAHPVLDMIAETVAEYEHGTANVEDVEGVTLKQYAAVALDLALVISAQS